MDTHRSTWYEEILQNITEARAEEQIADGHEPYDEAVSGHNSVPLSSGFRTSSL